MPGLVAHRDFETKRPAWFASLNPGMTEASRLI